MKADIFYTFDKKIMAIKKRLEELDKKINESITRDKEEFAKLNIIV